MEIGVGVIWGFILDFSWFMRCLRVDWMGVGDGEGCYFSIIIYNIDKSLTNRTN